MRRDVSVVYNGESILAECRRVFVYIIHTRGIVYRRNMLGGKASSSLECIYIDKMCVVKRRRQKPSLRSVNTYTNGCCCYIYIYSYEEVSERERVADIL